MTRPELDGEQEVDLGRYATAVAERWWLPLAGLAAGIVVGYLVSLGGGDVFRAQALVYLGEPVQPGGGRVEGPAATVTGVRELVRSEAVVARVARETGLDRRTLRTGTSVQAVSGTGAAARGAAQTSLLRIAVRGESRARVARAANELGESVVDRVSPYTDAKIRALRGQIAAANEEIGALDRQIAEATRAGAAGLTATDKLLALTTASIFVQRRSAALQTRLDREQLLALAETIERPRLLDPAVARRVTAQSRRNSVVAAGAIGLILGLLAALAWDPLARRFAR